MYVVRRTVMGPEATAEFIKMLGSFHPGWALAIVVGAIVAYRLPQILREVFAGIKGLRRSKK
jgi:hypothetical protein